MSRCTKFSPGGSVTSNRATTLSFNTYKPGGGGVGGSSIANRRAKNRLATVCTGNNCFPCYTELGKYSQNPNGFVPCPEPSTPKEPLMGSLTFSFNVINPNARTFTLASLPSPGLIDAILPVVTVQGVFEIKHKATFTSTNVLVEIDTFLYEDPELLSAHNFGLHFDKTYIDPDFPGVPVRLVEFYNSIYNLTFISANNCPVYRLGSQFKGLTRDFTILPTFTPLFVKGTSMRSCFSGCTNFNSDISFWDVSTITNMSFMFENNTEFNQDIGSWDVSNITDMESMFENATSFNNGGSPTIQTWKAHKCTNFSSMFQGAISFNQPLTNLVNTSGVTGCTMNAMFYLARVFNNGQTGMQSISGNVSLATYTNSTKRILGPGSTFTTDLTYEDVIIITTSSNRYISQIQSIESDETLIILNAYGINLGVSTITSINKQVEGSAPLNWDTSNVTNISVMFQDANYFNQYLPWDTSRVTYMNNLFAGGANNSRSLFNNGQLAGSFTKQLPWNTTSVTTILSMFGNNEGFNQNINNWNTGNVTNMASTFTNTIVFNNGYEPLTLNTSNVTTMVSMFSITPNFNQNIGEWDVSNVTSMESMFNTAPLFNNGGSPTIQTWTAHKCTNFSSMFQGAFRFNQPLTNLVNTTTVSSCLLTYMFTGATVFNNGEPIMQNISGTVSTASYTNSTKILTMSNALFTTELTINDVLIITTASIIYTSKIQSINSAVSLTLLTPFGSNILGITITSIGKQVAGSTPLTWNTSNVTDISYLFRGAFYFNQYLPWDTTKVVGMYDTFSGTTPTLKSVFNNGQLAGSSTQPLLWNTSNVTTIARAFVYNAGFNQNLNNWNTSKVTDMSFTLHHTIFNNGEAAGLSNQPLTWDTSNVIYMPGIFWLATAFNQDINSWAVSNVVYMSNMFNTASVFNRNIGGWVVSNVTNMASMFLGASQFNNGGSPTIQTWTAHKCTTFSAMFQNAPLFNQPIPDLVNTSSVSSCVCSIMFQGATSFNQNIGSWDISNVTTMQSMFFGASQFNNGGSDTIQSWKAHKCTTFSSMFQSAPLFNQPIPELVNTSSVSSCVLTSMFSSATVFNRNIGGWDVSNVTNTQSMFQSASQFNNGGSPNISAWTAPKCINFSSMFQGAGVFNQPIPELVNTSTVTDCTLANMFRSATQFNQNIGGWIVSNVTNMSSMFFSASVFNQNIGGWIVSNVTNMSSMFQSALQFNNGGSPNIIAWTAPKCINFSSMFSGVTVFNQPLPNFVNTSGVSTCLLTRMFESCSLFNQDISLWNLSNVTDISLMFYLASAYNNLGMPLTNWSAPKCTTFTNMFQSAIAFNQPIPILVSTSGVSTCNLFAMFQSASVFNQNISSWNVSNVTNMSAMFQNAIVFNNGETGTLGITGTATSAYYTTIGSILTCPGAAFLTELTTNDVLIIRTSAIIYSSKIETITSNTTLTLTINYGGNIGTVGAPIITSINKQVDGTAPLSWTTSNVTTLSNIFTNALYFNQNLNTWDVSKVTTMASTFSGASSSLKILFNNGQKVGFSGATLTWTAPRCTAFTLMFTQTAGFNQPIPNLVNTSSLTLTGVLNSMFLSASVFNQDINTWDVSRVSNMSFMFHSASSYNNSGVTLNWSAPLCTTFVSMFQLATAFNQSIPNLVTTSGVSSCLCTSMFESAPLFNQNISTWNTVNVTNMSSMFNSAIVFNNGELGLQNITGLVPPTGATYTNTTKILFCPGGSFLTTLIAGDVLIIQTSTIIYSSSIQSITNDTNLVLTTAYGSNISSGITNISKQIAGTSPLNWNTSNVTTMTSMFTVAPFFNQNITTNGNIWNTTKVTNAVSMFQGTATTRITLFNNGQIITGITAPMGWTFAAGATLISFRTNCRLTNSNKPILVT